MNKLLLGALAVLLLAACTASAPPPKTLPSTRATSQPAAAESLPDVSLAALDGGEPLAVAKLKGVPTVINLWASWCGPCKAELPLFARADRDHSGLRVIGIDFADPAADAARALAKNAGVDYRLYADPDSRVKAALRVIGLPQTVFVDEYGTIVATERRAFRDYADLSAALAEHLGVKS